MESISTEYGAIFRSVCNLFSILSNTPPPADILSTHFLNNGEILFNEKLMKIEKCSPSSPLSGFTSSKEFTKHVTVYTFKTSPSVLHKMQIHIQHAKCHCYILDNLNKKLQFISKARLRRSSEQGVDIMPRSVCLSVRTRGCLRHPNQFCCWIQFLHLRTSSSGKWPIKIEKTHWPAESDIKFTKELQNK